MADETKYPTRIAPYGLRMPPDLKARVEASAVENQRSLNAEIVATLLEKYPEETYSAEEFLHSLEELATPLANIDTQIENQDRLNATLQYMGIDFEAHIEGGDVVFVRRNR